MIFILIILLIPSTLFAEFNADYENTFHPKVENYKNKRYPYLARIRQNKWENKPKSNNPYNSKTDSYCVERSYLPLCH